MSKLEKYHGPVFVYDAAILEIMCGITFPISFIDYCGASLVVILLTGGCLITFHLIPKEISRMNRNGRLLCEISATGDIFKFCGILLMITFHLITVLEPYLTFHNVSCLRVKTDFFSLRRGGLS